MLTLEYASILHKSEGGEGGGGGEGGREGGVGGGGGKVPREKEGGQNSQDEIVCKGNIGVACVTVFFKIRVAF